jgi:hypothetical protein
MIDTSFNIPRVAMVHLMDECRNGLDTATEDSK